jgi:hypothetical protein
LRDLGFEEGQFGLVFLNFVFCSLDFLFEDLDLVVQLLELKGFLFVLLAFFNELVEHVFKVGFSVADFLNHFGLFLFKRLDFAVEHVPEVLKSGLLIPGIFTSFFFGLDNLESFEELMLHFKDFLIGL